MSNKIEQVQVELTDKKVKELAKANAKIRGMTLKGYVSSLINNDKIKTVKAK